MPAALTLRKDKAAGVSHIPNPESHELDAVVGRKSSRKLCRGHGEPVALMNDFYRRRALCRRSGDRPKLSIS